MGGFGFGQGYFGQYTMGGEPPVENPVIGPLHVRNATGTTPTATGGTGTRHRATGASMTKPKTTDAEQL